MAYCGPHGIPYEEWVGTGTGWTVFSRMAALAWMAREAERCGSCGQVHGDWLDANGVELRDPPYEVTNRHCPACESLHDHRQEAGDKVPSYLHPQFVSVLHPSESQVSGDGEDMTAPEHLS